MGTAAFAFRGYNVTNLGRSHELLGHAVYGPTVERYLSEASEICSSVVGRKVDLVARVRRQEETSLETYDEAISLIAAMQLAQIRLLEEFFDIRYGDVPLAYGYSLGELTAVVASGVFEMRHAMRIPLSVAADCVALAEGVTMGVLFSRGPLLNIDEVKRLCLMISSKGQGVIGISAILAPNTVLLLGQGPTIDRFGLLMHDVFPARVYLRKNTDHWPPVHTPLVWQRNIPNRVGVMMHTLPGGFVAPKPPVFSLVTGKASYNDYNSREILIQLDRPSAAAVGRGVRNAGLGHRNGDPRRPVAQPDSGHVPAAARKRPGAAQRQLAQQLGPAGHGPRGATALADGAVAVAQRLAAGPAVGAHHPGRLAAVATPLPPLKPSQTGKRWPRNGPSRDDAPAFSAR